MEFRATGSQGWYGGAWLLVATLALLVGVALTAAVGSAAWIARSGDEAREVEDRGMLTMAFNEHRSLIADEAKRTAAAIAELGPTRTGPVKERIEALLAPDPGASIKHHAAYLLREDAQIVASYPPTDGRATSLEVPLAKLIPLLSGPEASAPDSPHIRAHEMPMDPGVPMSPGMAMGEGMSMNNAYRRSIASTSFLSMDGLLHEVAVAKVGEPQAQPGSGALTGMTVVLVTRIDATLIHKMSMQHRVTNLEAGVTPPSVDRAGLTLTDAAGNPAGHLTWLRATPVSSAFREAMPFFAALALALCTLAGLAGAQSVRSHRKLAEQERLARHEADHDALTGLLNRTAFVDTVDRRLAEAGDAVTSILYLDLDGFKEINDTLGHQSGDELLICVAERIRAIVGYRGILARLGGDEFAMMVHGKPLDQAVMAGDEVSQAIRRSIVLQGKALTINVSIGLACAPMHGSDSHELLRRADIALYAAKKRGRGQVALFDHAMEETIQNRQLVELDLRAALGTNQIFLAFQLIVASDGSRPLGVEALLRWEHTQRGLIPPSEFIPIAEETGFIHALGLWVLQEACMTVKRWPGLSVAVNISPVQMRSREIIETVASVLADTGLEPGRLVLEVTEGVLIEHQDEATSIVQALQSIGVKIALDDFGTGYSSLAYLKRFPFNKLKIDKSFIDTLGQRADDATIVHAIISLGRALGMAVIAEGVETSEQHRFLRAAGCHEFQGYLFARPVRAIEVEQLLRKSPSVDIHRLPVSHAVADERQSVANVA